MTAPEPLIVGEASVRTEHGRITVRAIRLASCPGLAVTECTKRRHSWVVTHEASGLRFLPRWREDLAAPLAGALKLMRAVAQLIDWTADEAAVVRDWNAVPQKPDLGPEWLPIADIEPRRVRSA